MSTDRAGCTFAVREGPHGRLSIAFELHDNIPALSGKTLGLNLDPEATPEQAELFARVLTKMVAEVSVSD